jgi:ADP-ribose pyrophosphatase YjhB (NUDIX family)
MAEPKFAPREVFETILEWSVLPTFDLLVEYGDKGVVILRRTIEPYKNVWALPGLRMYKGESIDDTLRRIAKQELGLGIDPSKRVFVGQFVGKFKTEFNRQDLSTAYLIKLNGDEKLVPNPEHFSDMKFAKKPVANMGAMYKYYLEQYANEL